MSAAFSTNKSEQKLNYQLIYLGRHYIDERTESLAYGVKSKVGPALGPTSGSPLSSMGVFTNSFK